MNNMNNNNNDNDNNNGNKNRIVKDYINQRRHMYW